MVHGIKGSTILEKNFPQTQITTSLGYLFQLLYAAIVKNNKSLESSMCSMNFSSKQYIIRNYFKQYDIQSTKQM